MTEGAFGSRKFVKWQAHDKKTGEVKEEGLAAVVRPNRGSTRLKRAKKIGLKHQKPDFEAKQAPVQVNRPGFFTRIKQAFQRKGA